MNSLETMIRQARTALERAHAPYSRFRVGACVRTPDGALFAGCNVENASFPEGWCAETSAIAGLILAGEREIAEVVVITEGSQPCAPCGGCRQRLSEFASPETPIHMIDGAGGRATVTLGELLPRSFHGSDLEGFLPHDVSPGTSAAKG